MVLFLYGTLCDPRVLAARSGDPALPRGAVSATLPGWRRVRLVGAPFPTLRRDRATAVDGIVVRAGTRALARLCAYEGSRYRLRRVRTITAGRPVLARAWIGDAASHVRWDSGDAGGSCERRGGVDASLPRSEAEIGL